MGPLRGRDGNFNFEGLFAAAIDHAAQRRHIGEVAAPADGNMLQ